MPKRKKPSLLVKILKIIIGATDYFVVALVPAIIGIIGLLRQDDNMISNIPFWIWIVITGLLLFLAFSKGLQRYQEEQKTESQKSTRRRSKSIQSVANNDGQSIAIGGNSLAPIIQGVDNKQKRPDLTYLIQMREQGYLLRNSGMNLIDEHHLKEWIREFRLWEEGMLFCVEMIDKDKAKVLKLLGNVPRGTMQYNRIFNDEHALILDVFTEKLIRLDKIIDDYLKFPL